MKMAEQETFLLTSIFVDLENVISKSCGIRWLPWPIFLYANFFHKPIDWKLKCALCNNVFDYFDVYKIVRLGLGLVWRLAIWSNLWNSMTSICFRTWGLQLKSMHFPIFEVLYRWMSQFLVARITSISWNWWLKNIIDGKYDLWWLHLRLLCLDLYTFLVSFEANANKWKKKLVKCLVICRLILHQPSSYWP